MLPGPLGSSSVLTDATGGVLERLAYDPRGDRRTASGADVGASDPGNAIQPTSTDRGYTRHEHLDAPARATARTSNKRDLAVPG